MPEAVFYIYVSRRVLKNLIMGESVVFSLQVYILTTGVRHGFEIFSGPLPPPPPTHTILIFNAHHFKGTIPVMPVIPTC